MPKSIHYAWVIVAILSVVQIVGQAIGMAAGVMVAPLNDPDGGFGWSLGIIGAGLAVYYLVGAIFSPIAGWLADRYGTRKMMAAAGVSFVTSMVLLGFVSTLWQFFLVFGVLLAFTQSIAMVPMIAAVSGWFRHRLGLAVGLLWAAGGLGSAAIAPAVGFLLENVGWRATFWSIGIVGGAMILVLVPFFRNNPTDKGIRAYGVRDGDPEEISWSKTVEKLRLKTFNQHIRKTKEFWNLPLIHSLGCAGHGIILIYSIPIAVEQGISLTAAAFILSLINIFSIGSRFLTPMIAERVGGKPAMVAALAIQGVTVLVLFWAGDAWNFYVFAILFGVGFGGEMSAYPVVNRQYFGTGPIGTFYGIEIMGALIGHAVATALAGFVIFVTGSFAPVLVISMGFSLVGVIVVMTLSPSAKVLIPDWELSLPDYARPSVAEARADHDRSALLEQLAVD
ncbi:MAG TPA: MFS transporter [Dehalococcoidia bacterium]|nr:MFS transporter [Dehalococcoidia bacterium]